MIPAYSLIEINHKKIESLEEEIESLEEEIESLEERRWRYLLNTTGCINILEIVEEMKK